MISLASVLSALISEVFDHRGCAHSQCSGHLQHARILTGLDPHSLNLNNASHVVTLGLSPVQDGTLFFGFVAQCEWAEAQ